MHNKSILTINSLPVHPKKHGSINGTPIKAIGVFELDLKAFSEKSQLSLKFPNPSDNKIEEVVIPMEELKSRIQFHDHNAPVELVLWLMPDGYVFDATNIGIEGEWYFIAGGMAENTCWDFTEFRMKP